MSLVRRDSSLFGAHPLLQPLHPEYGVLDGNRARLRMSSPSWPDRIRVDSLERVRSSTADGAHLFGPDEAGFGRIKEPELVG